MAEGQKFWASLADMMQWVVDKQQAVDTMGPVSGQLDVLTKQNRDSEVSGDWCLLFLKQNKRRAIKDVILYSAFTQKKKKNVLLVLLGKYAFEICSPTHVVVCVRSMRLVLDVMLKNL